MLKFRGIALYAAAFILGVSFFFNAVLPWIVSCEGSLWFNQKPPLSGGRLGVVLSFNSKEIDAAIDAVTRWPWPCTASQPLKQSSVLILYSDADLTVTSDAGRHLREEVSKLPSLTQCFSEVVYLSLPPLTDQSAIYEKREEDGETGRGRNTLFYSLMLEQVSRVGSDVHRLGLQHVLWMEPDLQARGQGWLERIHEEAARPSYWVQGSSYRGKCLPNEDGTCSWVGRDALGYIGANALYHVADLGLITLIRDTSEGPFALRPFERGLYQHMSMAWPEYKHRDAMHLYLTADWVRDYGRYPVSDKLPDHVVLLHQEHPILEEIEDNYVAEPEYDLDRGLRGEDLQETALSLQQELLHLQSGQQQEGDEDHQLESPKDKVLTPALEKVATSRKQLALVFVSEGYHQLLLNFFHFASKHGLASHTLVAALDSPSVTFVKTLPDLAAWVDLTDHEFRGEGIPPFDPTEGEGNLKVLRLSLLRRCLLQGYRVLNSDLDVVWLKNPFQAHYFTDELDFWIQSDSHTGFVEMTKGGLREVYVSAGLSYAAPSMRTIRFLAAALHMAQNHPELTEQHVLRLSLTVNRYRLRYRALEPALFPNGFLYWEQTLPQSLGVVPMAVHNNMVDSLQAKIYRFREAGLWRNDEILPIEKLLGNGKKYMVYLDLVFDNGLGNKRVALRQALAMCEILGRTLILPVMHREHEEDTPVSLDYFFDIEKLVEYFPNVEPRRFLTAAFPDWETLPVHDIDIKLALPENVSITGRPQDVSWKERLQQVQGEWHPNGATPNEILGWYAAKEDPLLVFYSTFRRFGGFGDKEKDEQFESKVFEGIVATKKAREVADSIHVAVKAAARQASGKDEYSCLHVRRRSFLLLHSSTEKPVEEMVASLKQFLPLNRALYVTTDDPSEDMRATLANMGFPKVMFMDDFYPPWQRSLVEGITGARTMRHGQIDQLVCAEAETFVGNEYSTFTFHIAWLRERYGKKQICQDIYKREKTPGMVYQ